MALNIEFPQITAPGYPLDEELENALIVSQMSDGTIKTRPRFTRNRVTYSLSWANMPNAEKITLENFVKTTTKNGALPFAWVHPQTGETKAVRFTEMPQFSLSALEYWRVSVKLQEV